MKKIVLILLLVLACVQPLDIDKQRNIVSCQKILTFKTAGWSCGNWSSITGWIETVHLCTFDDGSTEEY